MFCASIADVENASHHGANDKAKLFQPNARRFLIEGKLAVGGSAIYVRSNAKIYKISE